MITIRKFIAIFCALALLAGSSLIPAHAESMTAEEFLSMSLDDDGSLQINRAAAKSRAMGAAGTWTVFVYLCAADLESGSGLATKDIQEMLAASTGSNVRFILQTGGCKMWKNSAVSSTNLERYEICNGSMTRLDTLTNASMGDGKTLSSFLKWGVSAYPAAKMGLIFWDHGSGSINGVCFDEKYKNDSLTLSEIHAALAEASREMTDQFEFIGFDACLMATVECANILASYARYMYGSEEVEAGYGWDYTVIGSRLGANPYMDGAALGKIVGDSFHQACAKIGQSRAATFSVIDLSKIDAVAAAFHTYAQNLYDATEDNAVLARVVREIKAADNYGGNNRSEGYTNMVDLAGIVRAGSGCAAGADAVLEAIDRAVVYKKNGSNHSNACGLSTYYPLSVQGSAELKLFGEVAVSPSYLSFVNRTAYGSSNEGSTENYQSDWVFDLWSMIWGSGSDWNWYDTNESWDQSGSSSYWESFDANPSGSSTLIQFYDGPRVLSDGSYGFSLTKASLAYTASVQGMVYTLSPDGEDLIELGITADIIADWDTGVFLDDFDGYWFSLADGQNLAVYLVEECYGYDVYTAPILLNGRQTNLRLTHYYGWDGSVHMDGVWDGIGENGMAGRDVIQLSRGDVITPLYNASSMTTDEEFLYCGEEYRYTGGTETAFDLLYDGEYYYGFNIDDIYGNCCVTDFVCFLVEDGEVYFYED